MDYISIKKLSIRYSIDLYQLKSYIEYLNIHIQEIQKVQSVSIEDSELIEKFLQTYSRNEISYIISHQIQPFFEGTLLLDLRKKYNLNEKQFKVKCTNANLKFKYVYSDSECQQFDDYINSNIKNRAELREEKYLREGWIPLREVIEEFEDKYQFSKNTALNMLKRLNIEVYKPLHQCSFISEKQKKQFEDFLKQFNTPIERRLFLQEQTIKQKYKENVNNPSQILSSRNKLSKRLKQYASTQKGLEKIRKAQKLTNLSYTTERKNKIISTKLNKYGTLNHKSLYIYDNLTFSSSWELYFYIYQKEILHNNIQKGKIFEYLIEDKVHRYECDFLVNGENIEIKGNQFLDKNGNLKQMPNKEWNRNKQECMKEHNVKIISKKEILPIIDAVNKQYTSDYVSLFRKNIPFPYPDIGHKSDFDLIRYFHKSIYEASRLKKPSPLKAWEDKELIKKSALNRLKYIGRCTPSDVVQGFNVAKIAPKISVFKPELAERLIKQYIPESDIIFDPFSGFSGRMLGVFNCGKQYFGFDINENHVRESNAIIDYKKIGDMCSVEVKDLITTTPKDYSYLKNACLFTCPPYGGKEHWNKNNDEIEKTCDEWIDLCLQKYRGCIKYLFVIDKTEKYQDCIVETIENKSHFGKNQEYVILIQK